MRTSTLIAIVGWLIALGAAGCAGDPPAPLPSTDAGPGIWAPLHVSPAWMPAGLVERVRELSSPERDADRASGSNALTRVWLPPAADSDRRETFVSLRVSDRGDARSRGEQVDIGGGISATVSGDGPGTSVAWMLDGGITVTVFAGGTDPSQQLGREEALRVARSVRPDAGTAVFPFHIERRTEFRFGDSGGTFIRASGESATSWSVEAVMGPDAKNNPRELQVLLGPATPAPAGGTTVPLSTDPPGRFVTNVDQPFYNAWLVREVAPGLLLTVRYWATQEQPPPQAELVKVAERTRVVARPDVSWIGTRPA